MSINGGRARAPQHSMDEMTRVLLQRLDDSVAAMTASVNQFTLQVSHLERTDLDFGARITKLENTVDMLTRPVSAADQLSVWKVRWEVVGSVVAVATSLLVFLMNIYGG